ncbi:MAG: beta-1,4-galactosyltransferase [Candidatus Aenigmarchaeota archaeon]|nr:beta-1,4-galactosyltransferase [Candidatus Aenigmarchaeota archaeon]MBU5689135.1 beta-1,4-galactosyltransferase [Candidatus Aenigmarchaeota archaeon]
MIFVTVGTNQFSFNRLIKKIDELIRDGKIKEEVVIQIGHSTYEPKHAKWFRFESYEKIKELTSKSRIVITHGGVGSILTALMYKKTVIAVPRMKIFNEHVDDHQVELVKELSKDGKIIAVFDIDKLQDAINKKSKFSYKSTRENLVKEIKEYIHKINK